MHKRIKNNDIKKSLFINFVLSVMMIAMIFTSLYSINNSKNYGYYQAKAKVVNVDRDEKVGEKNNDYKITIKYKEISGKQSSFSKSTNTFKTKQHFKKNDLIVVKTPNTIVKNGSSKNATAMQIISDDSSVQYFDKNNLKIKKMNMTRG